MFRLWAAGFYLLWSSAALADAPAVEFEKQEDGLRITIGGKPFATYTWADDTVRRPYLAHVHTPSGIQVTRHHPPRKDEDLTDHATMHPGIWLAFGDLGGADFWRNRARVRHAGFVRDPKGGRGSGSFTVRNSYEADGKTICIETCEITIKVRPAGSLLIWNSVFRSPERDFVFGDQEEMGLGIRMATPLAVVKGGSITDSQGRKNEPEVWGRQADWCRYAGTLGGRQVGVVLMPDPGNFRRSWFHARDYGLLVANPFGRNAFTRGEKSRVVVRKGEDLRLGFGVLIYDAHDDATPDGAAAYHDYLEQIGRQRAK